ncbi:hypothetical protein C0992_008945, partial [Termitomyces sp. T32_za158]
QENVSSSGYESDEEGLISPLSFTPEGSDELLDDIRHERYTKAEGNELMNISSDANESGLSAHPEDLLKALEEDTPRHRLSQSVSADIKDYGTAEFLNLSSVCFSNVLIAGEGKETDMRSAIHQATVYMHQRLTQPWLCFCLGFMVTKDKMGLLRADATGCLASGDILFLVRGLTQDERPTNIPLDKMKNRREVFTISALKRTLSQFETVEEFYHVLIGVLQ